MFRPTNNIRIEDGELATNGQYFLDSNGLHAVDAFDELLMTELAMNSYEHLPERHDGMFSSSSASLQLRPDQPSALVPHTLESDTLFTPTLSEDHYSTWMHYDNSIPAFNSRPEFQEPITVDIAAVGNFYSQTATFPTLQDCLYDDLNRDILRASTPVDLPGYNGFPSGTTCYTSASNFHPAFNNCQPNSHAFIRQEICMSDSNLRMALAPDTELRIPPIPSSLLPKQSIYSTSSLSTTSPTARQFARSIPAQQSLHQKSTPLIKRKRHTPEHVPQNLMIRDREQRVSKRARIPQSSVNIVSFEGEDEFRATREPRTESEKKNIQDLALLGGSCSRCEYTKKRCDKQTPCAGCVKFWTRKWNRSLSEAKRAGSASVQELSVVAKQAKHVLAHMYNKMSAVCKIAPTLPKLLSILDILTLNERRFLQSVLEDLQPKAIKDLGCYSYIIRMILATVTVPDGLSAHSPSNQLIRQRREFKLSSLCCQAAREPYFAKHTTHVSSIVGLAFGRSADMDSLESGPRDLELNNIAHLFKNIQQSFELSLLHRVRQGAAQNHLNLHPLCPHLFKLVELIKHSVKEIYSYDTCLGFYEVSVISRPAIPDAAIGVAVPFIVSRLESARGRVKRLRAVGWLMCSPIGDTDSVTSLIEAGGSALSVRSTNGHWLTRLNLGTMVKLELKRLETQLELEMNKLEREHGTCRCESCMPL